MKVLVADDSADNRQLVEDIVKSLGYSSIIARDGYEALRLAGEVLPDLLILDINMPGMSGFDVCISLKENPATRQIPILMLTALADMDSRVTGLGLGADDYLTKPFSPRELIARINARLRIKSGTDELRATQELIRQTFERFIPPQVVQTLLEHPEEVRLGGQLKPITVLFADLEGFTAVSEHTEPERLLSVLNQYHGLVVRQIQAEGGTLDKFTGDGVMALYNTPLPQDEHVLRAIRTAIRIRGALPTLHRTLDATFHLRMNIGIHTGQAIVGLVGADDLMDYTAIGDTVNLASRLQDLGRNGQILISEAAFAAVEESVTVRCLGPRFVRGRETAVTVYEVLELAS